MIKNNLPPLTDYKCIFCGETCVTRFKYFYKCENCSQHSLTTYSLRDRDAFLIHEVHLYNEDLGLTVYFKYFFSQWEHYSSKTEFIWNSDEADSFNTLTPIKFKELCSRHVKLRAFW